MKRSISKSLESMARLNGKTTYKDFREGFSGTFGFVIDRAMTDQDIAAALGAIRKKKPNGNTDYSDVSIQALQAYYGSTSQFDDELIEACLRHKGLSDHEEKMRSLRDVKSDRRTALQARYLENRGPVNAVAKLNAGMAPEKAHSIMLQRVAATVAVSRITASSSHSEAQWDQLGWFCCCSPKLLKDLAAQSESYLMDLIYQASHAFVAQLCDEKVA